MRMRGRAPARLRTGSSTECIWAGRAHARSGSHDPLRRISRSQVELVRVTPVRPPPGWSPGAREYRSGVASPQPAPRATTPLIDRPGAPTIPGSNLAYRRLRVRRSSPADVGDHQDLLADGRQRVAQSRRCCENSEQSGHRRRRWNRHSPKHVGDAPTGSIERHDGAGAERQGTTAQRAMRQSGAFQLAVPEWVFVLSRSSVSHTRSCLLE